MESLFMLVSSGLIFILNLSNFDFSCSVSRSTTKRVAVFLTFKRILESKSLLPLSLMQLDLFLSSYSDVSMQLSPMDPSIFLM